MLISFFLYNELGLVNASRGQCPNTIVPYPQTTTEKEVPVLGTAFLQMYVIWQAISCRQDVTCEMASRQAFGMPPRWLLLSFFCHLWQQTEVQCRHGKRETIPIVPS